MSDRPPLVPADHAKDFARRYALDLEIVAGQAMIGMGLTSDQIGECVQERGSRHFCLFLQDSQGSTVSHAGQVMLDSGLINPELLTESYVEATRRSRQRTRLPDHAQAIFAHELAEHEHGDHEFALIAAPETDRPISHSARDLLRLMERGWRVR